MTVALVAAADVEAAAERIRGVAAYTPLIDVPVRSALPAGPSAPRSIGLKCENFQPMGAFKLRGAYNMIARLSPDVRAAGVATYSSGNHGQAVALAARRLSIPAVVVMPTTAPHVKVEGVKRYGGEVVFAGTTSVDRRSAAEEIARTRGLTIVPPFDHPWIIAGAGTCGLEILEQKPDVTHVYVPVGGGGLISGIAAALKGRGSAARIIGVEPSGAAKMLASRKAGSPVRLDRTSSIADGLLPLQPGALTFAHVQAFVDDIVLVDDDAIAEAIRWLFRQARVVAEPSGAASVAAALTSGSAATDKVVAVVSGGNVSPDDYVRYIT